MLKMNQQNGVFSKKRIVFTTLLIAMTAAVYAQTVEGGHHRLLKPENINQLIEHLEQQYLYK